MRLFSRIGVVVLLYMSVTFQGSTQRKHLYCTAGSGEIGSQPSPACYCIAYHPDMCDDEAGPIPSCCRAGESGTKVEGCMCCSKKKTAKLNGVKPHSMWKIANEGLK